MIGRLVHSLALAVVSSVLVAPVAAAAPAPNGTVAPVASRADRDADALAVATDLVATEEPELHLSRFDEVLSWTARENEMHRPSWFVDDVAVTPSPLP